MTSHLLGDFQPAAVLEVIGDASGSETVAADLGANPGRGRTPPNHLVDIRFGSGTGREYPFAPGAKERPLTVVPNPSRLQVFP